MTTAFDRRLQRVHIEVRNVERRRMSQIVEQIATEDRVLVADLIIDAVHELLAVLDARSAVEDFSARIIRSRKFVRQFYSSRTVECRINAIVDEWRSQCDRAARIASRRCEGSPIARLHRGGRNID